jgi:hypothetical protein
MILEPPLRGPSSWIQVRGPPAGRASGGRPGTMPQLECQVAIKITSHRRVAAWAAQTGQSGSQNSLVQPECRHGQRLLQASESLRCSPNRISAPPLKCNLDWHRRRADLYIKLKQNKKSKIQRTRDLPFDNFKLKQLRHVTAHGIESLRARWQKRYYSVHVCLMIFICYGN